MNQDNNELSFFTALTKHDEEILKVFEKKISQIKDSSTMLNFELTCRPDHAQDNVQQYLSRYESITNTRLRLPSTATSPLKPYPKYNRHSRTRCSNVCFTEAAKRNDKQTNTRILCPYCDPFVCASQSTGKRSKDPYLAPLFYDTLGVFHNHHLQTAHGITSSGILVRRPDIGFLQFSDTADDITSWSFKAICPYVVGNEPCMAPCKFDPTSVKKLNPYTAYIEHALKFHLKDKPLPLEKCTDRARDFSFVPLHEGLHKSVLDHIKSECQDPSINPFVKYYKGHMLITCAMKILSKRMFAVPDFAREDMELRRSNEMHSKPNQFRYDPPAKVANEEKEPHQDLLRDSFTNLELPIGNFFQDMDPIRVGTILQEAINSSNSASDYSTQDPLSYNLMTSPSRDSEYTYNGINNTTGNDLFFGPTQVDDTTQHLNLPETNTVEASNRCIQYCNPTYDVPVASRIDGYGHSIPVDHEGLLSSDSVFFQPECNRFANSIDSSILSGSSQNNIIMTETLSPSSLQSQGIQTQIYSPATNDHQVTAHSSYVSSSDEMLRYDASSSYECLCDRPQDIHASSNNGLALTHFLGNDFFTVGTHDSGSSFCEYGPLC